MKVSGNSFDLPDLLSYFVVPPQRGRDGSLYENAGMGVYGETQ